MQIVDGLFVLPTDDAARELGCKIDLTLPNKIITFAETHCRLMTDDFSGEAGRPVRLTEWQKAVIRTLFGWRKADKTLRFTKASIWLARRQGKSILMAIICLFFSIAIVGNKISVIASTKEEAEAVFKPCVQMIEASDRLSALLTIKATAQKIVSDDHTEIEVLACNDVGKLGRGLKLAIYDEFAAWPAHSARVIYDRIHDSTKSLKDAVIISISTPQFDLTSLGYEKYRDAKAILDGKSDDLFTLPVIYAAPENFDSEGGCGIEKALEAACPSLDITTPRALYLQEWQQVRGTLEESRFKTMNLGLWVGSPDIWIPANIARACYTKVAESDLYGRAAIIGVDASKRFDLTAYCLLVQDDEGRYHVLPRTFIPKDFAQKKVETDNVPYFAWHAKKSCNLHLTPGDYIDLATVRDCITADAVNFRIQQIRCDATYLNETVTIWQQQGYSVVDVSTKPNTMSPAFEFFEKLAREGKLCFPSVEDNPLFHWCLNNCKPNYKRDERLMVEKASDSQRIDIIDAACIGLTYWQDTKNQLPVCPPGQKWAELW